MTREEQNSKKNEALEQFQLDGAVADCSLYGNGHINDTYLVRCTLERGKEKKYILQRMNKEIFKKPVELMENISGVTSYLRKKIQESGGDVERETMEIIATREGKTFYTDSIGENWRCYTFIEDATSFDEVKKPEDFYESAVAFGHFQYMLADYPAETLHETIAGFHDTAARFQRFLEVVAEDKCGRVKETSEEIAFVKAHEQDMYYLGNLLKEKKIPLRVTHNDTKLNNIMIDNKTGKGICVIDLDTVMPGLAVNDFGDSIRFGANTGAEDEVDLNKISLDVDLYNIYRKGFMEGCAGSLTPAEIALLPMGAKIMTLECGMRFLTDYLEGDVYFKIHREHHNLDRCRTQFKLVADIEKKWDVISSLDAIR